MFSIDPLIENKQLCFKRVQLFISSSGYCALKLDRYILIYVFKFTKPELITRLLKSSVPLCSLHAWPINDFIVQLHCVNIALHCD